MDWTLHTPEQIVADVKIRYPRMVSCSVMLSRLKSKYAKMENPPPLEYMKQIRLTKDEYSEIKRNANTRRYVAAKEVRTINNSDELVVHASKLLLSNDPESLFAALLLVTGMRPCEILKVAEFSCCDNTNKYAMFSLKQTRFAKRKSDVQEPRDRCLLAPCTLVLRAIQIVRAFYKTETMSNIDINNRFKSCIKLQDHYPMLECVTPRLLRRCFAAIAFYFFADHSGSFSSYPFFCAHHLGHPIYADECLSYTSIRIFPSPTISPYLIYSFKSQ